MRRFTLAMTILASAIAVPALAGVLLPNDSNEPVTGNLGLIPTQPTQQQNETPKITPVPITNTSNASPPTTSDEKSPLLKAAEQLGVKTLTATSKTPTQVMQKTFSLSPGGSVSPAAKKEMAIADANEQSLIAKVKSDKHFAMAIQKKLAFESSTKRAPAIIDEFTVPSPIEGKQTINIGIAQSYQWGAQDVRIIKDVFGYSINEIPQKCQLRIEATVPTDVSDYFFKGTILGGTRSSIKYSGHIKSINLHPMALCQPQKTLPPSGRIIKRAGQFYSTTLINHKNCANPSPDKNPAKLLVTYIDGKPDCRFE